MLFDKVQVGFVEFGEDEVSNVIMHRRPLLALGTGLLLGWSAHVVGVFNHGIIPGVEILVLLDAEHGIYQVDGALMGGLSAIKKSATDFQDAAR